jgi:hypothetical protein
MTPGFYPFVAVSTVAVSILERRRWSSSSARALFVDASVESGNSPVTWIKLANPSANLNDDQ